MRIGQHRRSIRLPNHDYREAGSYFLTLCTDQRLCLFGEIFDGEMSLSDYGRIAAAEWVTATKMRSEICLDTWVVMPNHIHGIVAIAQADNHAQQAVQPKATGVATRAPRSISTFVSGFKAAVTKRINAVRQAPGTPVWQRNYYDHIIRNEADLARIRNYIETNPLRWCEDQLHPNNPSKW
ncbi:MAG: transposase [Leptolyngbyaceae cyanobacterium]